jgi:HSP20 family protein
MFIDETIMLEHSKNTLMKGDLAMSLVRWSPFRDLSILQNQMNRLFDSSLHGWPEETEGTVAWTPAADIYETDNDLVLEADIPGIDPKHIDIRVENNVLTIRGQRNFEPKVVRENFHRVERSYGPFARVFTLSTAVDADKIRATYGNGVLSISLPKAEQAKPRRIQIAATAG